MQVNLKQTELISAIKNYIAHQGISLVGKVVTVSFTAGRKESGISAEVDIEVDESYIPPVNVPVTYATASSTTDISIPVQEDTQEEDPFKKKVEISSTAEDEPEPVAIKTHSLFS